MGIDVNGNIGLDEMKYLVRNKLPTGLTWNPYTQTMSGTPTEVCGPYCYALKCINGDEKDGY